MHPFGHAFDPVEGEYVMKKGVFCANGESVNESETTIVPAPPCAIGGGNFILEVTFSLPSLLIPPPPTSPLVLS